MLDQRATALVNRLLVEADRQGFPLPLLNGPTNEAARADWQVRYDRALMEALAEVERSRTRPRGFRKVLHVSVVTLANVLPELVFVASFLLLLWRFFDPQGVGYKVTSLDLLLPFALTLFVLVFLQLLSESSCRSAGRPCGTSSVGNSCRGWRRNCERCTGRSRRDRGGAVARAGEGG